MDDWIVSVIRVCARLKEPQPIPYPLQSLSSVGRLSRRFVAFLATIVRAGRGF